MKFKFPKINIGNVLKAINVFNTVKDVVTDRDKSKSEKVTESVQTAEAELGIEVVDNEKLALLVARVARATTEVMLAEEALRQFVESLKVRHGAR